MATWYSIKRGHIALEQTFDTYEEAELLALVMCAITGDQWHAEFTCGMDV